jgi:pyruvate dehydrogenase E2 component (dihydrolipoamide acetyltransferase)
MAEIYRMPSISPTMEVGTIVEWRVAEGATFKSGAVVADVGTDKATMEAEVFDDGVMLAHLAAEGEDVPTGAPMAILGSAAGEDIAAMLTEAKAELAAARSRLGAVEAVPVPVPVPEPAAAPASAPPPPAAKPTPAAPPTPAAKAPPAARPVAPTTIDAHRTWQGKTLPATFMDPPGDLRLAATSARVLASPLARKVADDLGVKLGRVTGTGPGGRIVRSDVEQAAASQASGPAFTVPADEQVKLTPMRKTIAKRLLQSHQDIPTFFLTTAFDVSGLVQLRAQLKVGRPDLKVSYNDMVTLAVARSLRAYPQANASWTDRGIIRHGRVDVGIAVALPDGLITPVLRNADQIRPTEVGAQIADLAERARAQRLLPEEYTGGTFTISNLGMFGIDHFTAIINPPEAAILAVGQLAQVPVVVDGALAVGWRMSVTMTCDHRVIDGATGAAFLQVLRRHIENPVLLLL